MNSEDDEFNRIEREAKQRMAAVKDTIRYRDAFPKDYRLPKPWVGLTDAEWESMYGKFAKYQEYGSHVSGWGDFARAIEAKLREKNESA